MNDITKSMDALMERLDAPASHTPDGHKSIAMIRAERDDLLDALEQINATCTDNAPPSCRHEFALHFVGQVARAAISKATNAP